MGCMIRFVSRTSLAIGLLLAAQACGGGDEGDGAGGQVQDSGGDESDAGIDAEQDAALPDAPSSEGAADAGEDAVDVVVSLEVVEAEPEEAAVVPRNRPLRFRFANAVVRSTLSVEVNGQAVRVVSTDDTTFRYAPLTLFDPDSDYTIRIAGGVTDVDGAVLQADWTRSFRTDGDTTDVNGDPAWTAEEVDLILSGAQNEPMDLVQDYATAQSALYDVNAPVLLPDGTTDHLVERMIVSMSHHGGVGLAAPQVGIPRRLFVARIAGETRAFPNPVLTAFADEVDSYVEGCLSVPSTPTQVLRPTWVELSYEAQDGVLVPFERIENGTGIHARVWLHEFDHLNGILLLARAGY